jgi:hypothetical protein
LANEAYPGELADLIAGLTELQRQVARAGGKDRWLYRAIGEALASGELEQLRGFARAGTPSAASDATTRPYADNRGGTTDYADLSLQGDVGRAQVSQQLRTAREQLVDAAVLALELSAPAALTAALEDALERLSRESRDALSDAERILDEWRVWSRARK